MIPRTSKLGSSFKGCGLYYLRDKGASTSERVAFTHTENIPTQDPEKALKWMAFTAIHADELKRENGSPGSGQRCHKPVFTFSLSWNPEQQPDKWDMISAGRSALIALGLIEHETVMVAHRDTEHPHLHCIVSTIHPESGNVNSLSYSRLKLSKWAQGYETEQGKIYCEKRVENNKKREQGEYVKYEEPQPEFDHKTRIAALYHASDCGKAFQQALGQAGYKLAQGKRIVVIDKDGNLYSLSRQVDDVKATDIRAKLGDLELPSIDEAGKGSTQKDAAPPAAKSKESDVAAKAEQKAEDAEPEFVDRDQQDRDWQESIISAGIETPPSLKPKRKTPALPKPKPVPTTFLNRLQERHLAELGDFYEANFQARQQLNARMGQQYGAHERDVRGKLSDLQQTLANSGRVQKLWLALRGQIPWKAEEAVQDMQRTLDNLEWRKAEAQRTLENDLARQRSVLEERQQSERLALQPKPPPPPAQRNAPDIHQQDGSEEDDEPGLSF